MKHPLKCIFMLLAIIYPEWGRRSISHRLIPLLVSIPSWIANVGTNRVTHVAKSNQFGLVNRCKQIKVYP